MGVTGSGESGEMHRPVPGERPGSYPLSLPAVASLGGSVSEQDQKEADRQRRIMARVLRDRKRDSDPDDDRD